jgi:hypothetical protein
VLLTSLFLQVGDGTSVTNRLTPVAVVGLGSGVANVALGFVRLFFMGHDSWVFCVAAHCAVDVVVEVVCAVFCCCGELGLRSGKCVWLIAHCGWVVLWRDQGGVRCGFHVWFAVPFVCGSKQWGGLVLGCQ